MKTAVMKKNISTGIHYPYPNTMTWKDRLHKFLDLLMVAAMGAGFAAVMLFVVAFA